VSAGLRRRSREAALQVLYAADLAGGEASDAETAQQALDAVTAAFDLREGARVFAKELVTGVASRRAEIDALLEACSTRWRLARMPVVDRNVLRIGVFELLAGDVPVEVVIDEAVELARHFGGEGSPAFVNGVLDAVAHRVRR
jgi:N utilization substance protein B